MKHKRPPVPMIILLVLALLTGGYFGIKALIAEKDTGLTASGTIEADAGRHRPRDQRQGGRSAWRSKARRSKPAMSSSAWMTACCSAQREVAASNLAIAQSARQLAEAALATAAEQSGDLRTSDWWLEGPDGYSLPGWYFSRNENVSAQQVEVGERPRQL